MVTTPHIGPHTVKRWFSYIKNKEWGSGTFEMVRGRNLRVGQVERWFLDAGLRIIEARAIGSAMGRYCRSDPFDRMFGPYLYILGQKMG